MNRYIFAILLILIVFLALGCTGSGAGQAPSNEQGQKDQGQEEQGQKDQRQREKGQQQALNAAVQGYYKAVDSKDWDYTYDELDSQTRHRFTREEWVQKNQYFADNSPLERSSPEVVGDSTSPPALVTLTQTFKDGTSRSRDTYFVLDNDSWKHRFSDEEYNLFMADASFEEFKKAQGQPEVAQQPGEKKDQPQATGAQGGLSDTYGCYTFAMVAPKDGPPLRFIARPDGTWTDITFGPAKAVEGTYTVSGGKAQFFSAQGTPLYNFSIEQGGVLLVDKSMGQSCKNGPT